MRPAAKVIAWLAGLDTFSSPIPCHSSLGIQSASKSALSWAGSFFRGRIVFLWIGRREGEEENEGGVGRWDWTKNRVLFASVRDSFLGPGDGTGRYINVLSLVVVGTGMLLDLLGRYPVAAGT